MKTIKPILFAAVLWASDMAAQVATGQGYAFSTIAGSPLNSASSTAYADGVNSAARFDGPAGIAVDSLDTVYIADQFHCDIRKATRTGANWVVTTIAGNPGQFNFDRPIVDGTNGEALFYFPTGLTVDGAGNVYVADQGNNAIREIIPVAGTTNCVVVTIAGNGSTGSADGTNEAATFDAPSSMAIDANSNLFVVDQNNSTIREISPVAGTTNWEVTTIAGSAGNAGYANGVGANASFYTPSGIAVDTNGNVYVADQGNNVIRMLTPVAGTTNWSVSTIAGNPYKTGSIDGTNGSAQFNNPSAIAVDTNGNVYVADQNNCTIRRIAAVGSNWVVSTIGGRADVSGTADGLGTNALFNFPSGLAVDGGGNIFVADTDSDTLRMSYVPTGSLQVTINPPGAAEAGAEWQVDGGALQASGAVVTNLLLGSHSLSYTAAAGWITPGNQTVIISFANTSVIFGVYNPQTGSLQVALTPNSAVSAGAAWQVDGGPFFTNGATQGNLAIASNHTVSFKAISGFVTPASQLVGVSNNLTTLVAGAYSTTNKPAINIVSPKANLTFTSPALNVTGTASDKIAVSGVFLQVNAAGWNPASSLNHWTNWSASVNLAPGTNTIFAYAMDTSGNFSTTNFVKCIYNPYVAAQGNYNGLFAVLNAPREQTNSGGISLKLTSTGSFSGRLLLAATTNVLSGKFDMSGRFQTNFSHSSLSAILQLDFSNHFGGTVGDGVFTAQVAGDKQVFSATHPAAIYQGSYALVIPGSVDPTIGPFGTSYGTLTVDVSGNIVFAGNLADGTVISQSSAISPDGNWPMYIPLYGGKGSLWGWNYFTNRTITLSQFPVAIAAPFPGWIKPANANANPVNRSGFTNLQATVQGFSYVSTAKPPLALTNAMVTLTGGGLAAPITNFITLSRTGLVTGTNAADKNNKLTLAIKTSGLVSGSFANPTNSKLTIGVNGVLLQAETNAAGYFTNAGQSGMILIVPE